MFSEMMKKMQAEEEEQNEVEKKVLGAYLEASDRDAQLDAGIEYTCAHFLRWMTWCVDAKHEQAPEVVNKFREVVDLLKKTHHMRGKWKATQAVSNPRLHCRLKDADGDFI